MSQRLHRKFSQARGHGHSLSQPSTSTAHIEVDEDDDQVPASQISPNKNLTNQEHTHHVANVVKHILASDHDKIPIAKASISKAVGCHNRNFKSIMDSAVLILKDVFGYKVTEIEGKLIITNEVLNNLPHLVYDEPVSTRYVLLFLILAHIYMSGEQCTQGSLVNFLTKLGIISDGNMKSDTFGDVGDAITSVFVKEKYLQMEKSENNEIDEPEYRWGARSEKELSRRTVMEFVSKVYRGKSMESWPQQFERMVQLERQQYNAQNGTR